MKTSLHAHQVIGTSWMLSREFCENGPYGGILADEMGMGKTLETLACIVSNRPGGDDLDTYSATTLIVAPATSIEQWVEEVRKHADSKYIGAVLHYKQTKELPIEAFKNIGIILVSYQAVSRQFPSKKLRAHLQNDCGSVEEWKERYDDNLGPLFKIPFWRVVLDEAHYIKNKDSQMSVACQHLSSRHRWGLSGTPITNSVNELYPYLKFLKADWAGDLSDFQSLYGNSADDEAANRLMVIMDILMLRRTMKDTFMGRPLYEIPICHISVRRVRLTKEERVIYSVVESRYCEIINNILKEYRAEGKKVRMRDLEIYIVFLLRLRQAAAHPFLLEPVLKKTLKHEDLLKIKSLLRQFNMDKQLDIALASKQDGVCRFCYQEPVEARTAECEHVFCRECLENYLRDEIRGGRIIPRCPECNKSLTGYESLEQSDEEDSDNASRDSFKQHPKLKKSQSKFLRECDQAYPKPVVPSAKTTAVKEAILAWQSEAPNDKIIVFMEFKMTGAILGRMLEDEGIPFLYFFGDMSQVAKQNALRGFPEKKEIKVMIASIRCGSVALNLTCANRVILVDLWWNTAIEMQAFGRVFRIGQTKETHFLRIVAERTIDNRIEALQEEKMENISKALEPGDIKLSTEEVAALFGHLQKAADGSLKIVPDGEDDSGLEDELEQRSDEEA
ncbi:SNF2 family N-terminal domain-containing protein [Xylariaceae sp. AK1471]|nr:SNF2 family N-terminal domain-containing protein [Xylariaceae sp. AK1471]